MRYGGVSNRLVDFAKTLFRKSSSALGTITVVACAFFGAISGSAAATVAAIGGIMIPEMIRNNYGKEYSVALASSAGYLGILIPPSVPLILFGVTANKSIGDLFIAGIVPGCLAAVVFVVLNHFLCPKASTPATVSAAEDRVDIWKSFLGVLPGLMMPVIILGGIYGGIFTATEAAAVAILYGLLVSVHVYKEIRYRDILRIAYESALISAKIMFIIAMAGAFGRLMSRLRVPAQIVDLIMGVSSSHWAILLLINAILLLLGMVMETGTAIIITTPILLPIATGIGMDPIHFGVMMVFNLAIGLITPPMALNLFVGAQISGVPIPALVRPIIPFVLSSLLVLALVVCVPELSIGLAELLKGFGG